MDKLIKNQIYEAEINGYSSTGAGVCRINGRAVFVKNTLIGEVWDVLILKVSKTAVYGKGVKLKKPSPERRDPPCPIFGKCGGCDLMHMSYDEEKRFKLSRVNDAINRIACLDFSINEIIGAELENIYRYRNKGIYAVTRNNDGHAVTGFYRERSHDVVPAPNCLIQTDLSVKCTGALRKFMDETGVSAYDEKTGNGQIRRLFTRCSLKYPQSVAVIVAAKGLHEHTKELIDCLTKACPELTGIVLCINKSRGNNVLSGEFHTLWGSDIIEDELCGLKFRISPASFYQINPRQAEKLYERAVSYASPNGESTVLDLYCGTGTISLCLAAAAKKVYGAEIVESAVLNARRNAEENGMKNVEFLLGDAAKAAELLKNKGVKPDSLVVDPPRKGLSESVINTVSEMSPKRLVYVSCDPGTLARDMKRFAELGYLPKKGTAVDMFPRCAHVETVVLMTKCGADGKS